MTDPSASNFREIPLVAATDCVADALHSQCAHTSIAMNEPECCYWQACEYAVIRAADELASLRAQVARECLCDGGKPHGRALCNIHAVEECAELISEIDRLRAENEQLRSRLCKCDMQTRLVGDGCQYCNPELAEHHARASRSERGD